MRVLVACEFSGLVRNAFIRKGHDAYSCDLRRCYSGPNSDKHFRQDVTPLLRQPWDLVIAHPPCTYLCNSGVRWLDSEAGRWDRMVEACEFFIACLHANAPRVCVENPIMHGYARGIIRRKPTQLIQPWQFGHPETKSTYLWLRGLPKLTSAKVITSRSDAIHKASGKARDQFRSITFEGVAEAMADQWGEIHEVQRQ